MPRPPKGSPEAKAWGEKMKAAREAKQIQELPRDEVGATVGIVTDSVVGAKEEIVGAKLSVDTSEIKSMLEEITEDSEVDIYNPLDQGFRVQFTVTAYQPTALRPEERDAREKTGAEFTKDMNQSTGHVVKFTVLPSHKVTRLPGKVAHVAIKQLRNYLIGTANQGKKSMGIADPATQRLYEEQIVMKIGNSMEMDIDRQNEIDREIAALNPVRS